MKVFLSFPRTSFVAGLAALLLALAPGLSSSLFAQAGNERIVSEQLRGFQEYLGQVQSLPAGEMIDELRGMAEDPGPYLRHIVSDVAARRYVRMRALRALAHFNDEATGRFLEGRIMDEKENPAFRNQAVRSYAAAYLKKKPDQARRFLVESARRILNPGVRNEIAAALSP